MSIQKKPVRNLAARSTLLRKAGPHIKSKTGLRAKIKLSTRTLADEWLDELDNSNDDTDVKKGAEAPFFTSVSFSTSSITEISPTFSHLIGGTKIVVWLEKLAITQAG